MLVLAFGLGARNRRFFQWLESLRHPGQGSGKKRQHRCAPLMLHLTLELLRGTAVPDHYGKFATAIVLILLVHSWARGPALLEREERIEAYQRRAHEKNENVRVTAGLGAVGGRTVLIGVRCITDADGFDDADGPGGDGYAGAARRAYRGASP